MASPASGSPRPGPGELQARTADLADAEARYHADLAEPGASETDRLDAAENLDRAQARMLELTSGPPAPGAELVGLEVCSPDNGEFIGPVERTEHLAYDGAEPPEVDVVMVRHTRGDGQLRAYELHEVREYVAEGKVIGPRRGTEPEAEAEI